MHYQLTNNHLGIMLIGKLLNPINLFTDKINFIRKIKGYLSKIFGNLNDFLAYFYTDLKNLF